MDSDLFRNILINPVQNGYDELRILAGYSTPVMSLYHLERLSRPVDIRLIIGMIPLGGINAIHHHEFKKISGNPEYNFSCSYIIKNPPIHSKIYIWYKSGKPTEAFAGSANYTQQAFVLGRQREFMIKADPEYCHKYFSHMQTDSLLCNDPTVERFIELFDLRDIEQEKKNILYKKVTVSLLRSDGEIHEAGGGLNWGQRLGREPNQAYMHLTPKVRSFFPDRGVLFNVQTDDGEEFTCARRQDEGKGLHSIQSNSILGRYFRRRIGVPEGEFVTKSALEVYGRTDVTFYKCDEETYYMDFST